MFKNVNYIKANMPYIKDRNAPSPLFRRTFTLDKKPAQALLHIAALGYGYCYINGQPISDNLVLAPVADYTKTVWYTSHDVSALLKEGENVLAVECGNGWYNESFKTAWKQCDAAWRDNPKVILKLEGDGETLLTSDDKFVFSIDSPVIFNQLRLGEYYDSRLYREGWNDLGFDDSGWESAILDDTPPTGVLRPCLCQPIREGETFEPIEIRQIGDNRYLYDFGQTMSGYLRITVDQPSGDKITLHYGENIGDDGDIIIRPATMMDRLYPEDKDRWQIDEFICCGKEFTWKPQFTYHGFRYVVIDGLRAPCAATAIFVHQDIAQRSHFSCSNKDLTWLFRCGVYSNLSNFFYMPTDCPSREKMGWCNDPQSSCEQFLTNFETAPLLDKWLQDVCDGMREDGMLPGIAPTGGYGFKWGNGPVSEGILYEIPYRIWLHTGNTDPLMRCIPYFDRHLAMLDAIEEEGEIRYGLDDWTAPSEPKVDAPFINAALQIKFWRITTLAYQLAGKDAAPLIAKTDALVERFKKKYLQADGRCTVHKQTAVAMMLVLGLYNEQEPLKAQLAALVEEKDYHHDCGMVGLPYLYNALNLCGLQEYAYKIITAKGYPSYSIWLEDGATTLYEYWHTEQSKNHQMYSDFMSWLVKTPLGLTDTFEQITVNPYFFEDLDFVDGHLANVALRWERKDGGIELTITVGDGAPAVYQGNALSVGTHKFIIKE